MIFVQSAADLAGVSFAVVGFFGDFSPRSAAARPGFDAFAGQHPEVPVYMVDVGRVRGVHPQFGVERVPSAVTIRDGRVVRRAEGALDPAAWARALLPHEGEAPTVATTASRPLPIVYTTPTCVWCGRVKSWLTQQGVSYREVDISADSRAADALVAKSGQMGVPQIEVGSEIVVGFDRPRLAALLGVSPS